MTFTTMYVTQNPWHCHELFVCSNIKSAFTLFLAKDVFNTLLVSLPV